MKILEVGLDGIYRFRKTNLKFYTNRKAKNIYLDSINKYGVSNIYSKDVNIIIGGNASGKTTLSKSIYLIERLLRGYQVEDTSMLSNEFDLRLKYLVHNSDDNKDYVYEYKISKCDDNINEVLSYITFSEGELVSAKMKVDGQSVSKFNNLKVLKESNYQVGENGIIKSNIFDNVDSNDNIMFLASNCGYIFSHRSFGEHSVLEPEKKIPEKQLSKFLSLIDKSINKAYYTAEDKKDFYIVFNNGKEELVNHSNIKSSGQFLSYGTVEAIIFLFRMYQALGGVYNTIFIDEELSHIHSELEKALLLNIMSNLPSHSQLFFTTHNLEIIKMDLPVNCFTILAEDDQGYTYATHAEDHMTNKSDRNDFYSKLKANYFSTEKYFDELFDIFEELIDERE